MNVFFISDNRDAPNWGCRATSESLEKLIFSSAGDDANIRTVGLLDIHLAQPYSPFTQSNFILGNLRKVLFARSNPKKLQRTIAKFLYVVLFPFFNKPFLYQDSIPNSVEELDHFFNLFKAKRILEKERKAIEWADVIIANGEGAFYQDERKGKYILFLLYVAKVIYKKPVILANHMFDVKGEKLMSLSKKIYPYLDDIIFRDYMSLEIFQKNIPGLQAKAAPDAAFGFTPTGKEFSKYLAANPKLMDIYYGRPNHWGQIKKPFVILGGSSIINKPFFVKNYDAVAEFKNLVGAFQRANISVVLCVACKGDSFLEEVALLTGTPLIGIEVPTQLMVDFYSESSCFISGRYHPMILASVSGTPTIIFDSNSHKTISLRNLLGLEEQPIFELKDLSKNIDQIVQLTKTIIDNEASIRQKILDRVVNIRPQIRQHTQSLTSIETV